MASIAGISAGTAVAILTLNSSPFTAGLKSAKEQLKTFTNSNNTAQTKINALGGAVTTVGATMTKSLTIPILGAGAAAIKTTADFDSSMSRVKAISGAVGEDFNKLRKQAIDLGASTSFSAKEAAEGMENLASAGFNVTEIMSAMPGMLDLAASGGVDLASAADISASTLRGFGLEASKAGHVADVLAKAAADTNAGITDTGEAMKYVAPVARSMGLSLEEVTAAIGEMSNAGIKGGQAGTSLRAALTRLANPSDEAGKLMKELGFSAYDSTGKMLPLKDIIGNLEGSMKGLSEQEKQQAIATIFGQEAMSGMLTLIQAGPQELDKLTNSFKNSDGAAKQMATTMKDNLKGSWDELTSALEGAMIAIGDRLTPMIRSLTIWVNNLVNWFNGLSDAQKDMVVKVALIVAAIGPAIAILGFLIGTVSKAIGIFNTLKNAFSIVKTALTGLSGVFTFLTSPIGIAIIAIAALAAAAYLIYKNWEPIKAFFINLWNGIKDTVSKAWEGIKTYLSETWNNIKTSLSNTWNSIKESLSNTWNSIKEFFIGLWDGIKSIFMTAVNAVVSFVTDKFGWLIEGIIGIFNGYITYFSGIWEVIKNIFLGAILLIIDLVTGNFDKLKTDAMQIWENIKNGFSQIWEGIKQIFSSALGIIKDYLLIIWNSIKTNAVNTWEGIKSFFITTWNNLKSEAINTFEWMKNGIAEKIKSTKEWIVNTFNSIVEWFSTLPSRLYQKGTEMFNSLKSGIASTYSGIKSSISNGIENAMDYIRNLPNRMLQWGKDTIQGFIDGITSKIKAVKDGVASVANSAANSLRNVLGIHSPSRVMMELGGYTGEGFALGIQDSLGLIRNAVNGMSGAVTGIGSTNSSLALNGASGSASTSVKQPIVYRFELVNNLDGREISREIVEYMSEDLADLNKWNSIGTGGID